MRFYAFALILFASFLLAASCGPFQRLDKRSKLIAVSKEGIIRGANFDIGPDSVKKIEGIAPAIEQDRFLSYSFAPDNFPQETLKVDYLFNVDNQLDFIAIDYRTNDDEAIKDITNNLRDFFRKRFGDGRVDELGWSTWDFKDTIGVPGNVEIILINETDPAYKGVKVDLVKYFEGE